MARVIVSAGHTQNEPGAVKDDLREVDLTHKITARVTAKLRDGGIITLSVPPELDLLKRIDWINKTGYKEEAGDICIEIHINDGGKSGLEGWYKDKGENKSCELTKSIVEEACKVTGLESQGVKSEYDHPLQTLAFVHNTNPTSALIECLYIDNPSDQEFLRNDSKLDLLAGGIVKGILKFFGIEGGDDQAVRGMGTKATSKQTMGTTAPFFPASPSYPTSAPIQPYSPVYPTSPPYGGFGPQGPSVLSREDKKKMVQEKYQQILGRKVSEQDLNYFLNLRLSEGQMIRRLVGSQEHADLVKESQEFKNIKPEYDKLRVENQELKSQLKDKENLIVQQNQLIVQKNKSIQELQQSSSDQGHISRGDTYRQPSGESSDSSLGYQQISPPKETFLDKVLRKLNDIFD